MTNSRDTQELLPEAGQEMMRIFHSHPARTSLLQDFAFYEVGFLCAAKGQVLTWHIAPGHAERTATANAVWNVVARS